MPRWRPAGHEELDGTHTSPVRVRSLSHVTKIAARQYQGFALVGGDAQDTFGRAVSSGWGSAALGGAYATNRAFASALSVDGSVGVMRLSVAGASPWADLPAVPIRAALDELPDGGIAWVAARARVDAASHHRYYMGQLRLDQSGRAYLVALRYANGAGAHLAPRVGVLNAAGAERAEVRAPSGV